MRRVISSTFVSLDGVMQAPGGPQEDTSDDFRYGGWVFPHFDAAVGEAMDALFARPFALLLGRKTYDIFAAFWPTAEDGHESGLARRFNEARKYVATRSKPSLEWQDSIALLDAAPDVARLKEEDGPDLLIQGSGELFRTLLAHGLVDEFTLLVFPVVLGGGKRLFDEAAQGVTLERVDSNTSPSGVVITTYRPVGAVETGSFA